MRNRHEYCYRCQRGFSSWRAIQQHCEDSSSHHQCAVCDFVGCARDELLQHYRSTEHRIVCLGCNDGRGGTWLCRSQAYFDHLQERNVCRVCQEHFSSPSNLHHHQVVHWARSIECHGCYRKFSTYHGMIIHLESGACPSQIDMLDLNESAAQCFQWKAYLNAPYRNELLERCDLKAHFVDPVYPFRCLECATQFSKLSALFNHVHSNACSQGLYDGKMGKLVHWLDRRHDLGSGREGGSE